jgi:hypothetical protein
LASARLEPDVDAAWVLALRGTLCVGPVIGN